MNNKKGISTIVATVLIVLITVAAVTILWAAISPMISQDLSSKTACFNAQNAIKIDTNQQYTCRKDNGLSFRMSRSSDDIDLKGAKVYIERNGETQPTINLSIDNIPAVNQVKVNDTETVTDMTDNDDITISIAPVILIDGAETACEKSASVTVNVRTDC